MTIEKTREFRLNQSAEKLDIAKRLLAKGECGGAIVQAYLSIFYAVRILLLDHNSDSDDFTKIVSLSKEYLQPSGWLTVDIGELLISGKKYHDQMGGDCLHNVSDNEAKTFIDNASKIYTNICRKS